MSWRVQLPPLPSRFSYHAIVSSNCDAESRRVLCCVLQLMTHLLACDAALRAPADFVEHLPFLLEKVEASFPDPHDPVRALVEPVHARLEELASRPQLRDYAVGCLHNRDEVLRAHAASREPPWPRDAALSIL